MKLSLPIRNTLIFTVCSLVVIGALAPTFSQSVRNAQRNACQANLRAIGLAFRQYTKDYGGAFPPATIHGVQARGVPIQQFGRITGTDYSRTPVGWADALQPYLKSVSTLQCPSGFSGPRGSGDPTKLGYTDYWYNARLSGERNLRDPARTFMASDGDETEATNATYSKVTFPADWNSPQSKAKWLRYHNGTANYLFADGHIKWCNPSTVTGFYSGTFAVR